MHEFLPEPCKKGHPTVKQYPSGQKQCLTCQNLYRQGREKKLREGLQNAAGKPPRTKQQMREVKMQIAAMAGAGMTAQVIAAEVGRNTDQVEQVIRKDVANDEELRALFKQAERTLAPKALAAAEKLINHIARVAEGYDAIVGKDENGKPIIEHVDTAPQHAAQALREMRPFIGLGDRPQIADAANGVQEALANAMQKPDVAAAVVQAIMASRAKQLGGRSE